MSIVHLEQLFIMFTQEISTKHTFSDSFMFLEQYIGTDWTQHILTKPSNGYTYGRNLVYKNEEIEVYIITWFPNSQSAIHDHPEIGCIVKILENSLNEDIYELNTYNKATFIKTTKLNVNSISFKSGNKILHKIINPNNSISVSLHVYSKPQFCCKRYST